MAIRTHDILVPVNLVIAAGLIKSLKEAMDMPAIAAPNSQAGDAAQEMVIDLGEALRHLDRARISYDKYLA